MQYPVGRPCPRSREQDQPFPGAAAGPGAPAVPGWVSGWWLCWLCSTPGARGELVVAPSPVGPTEQGRGWGAWARLVLAVGQPQPRVCRVLRLRPHQGSCGATPARPCHGGCVATGAGAQTSLSVWCLGLRLPGHITAVRWSMFAGCLGGSRWHPMLRSHGADKESLAAGYSLFLLVTVLPGRGRRPPTWPSLCQGSR